LNGIISLLNHHEDLSSGSKVISGDTQTNTPKTKAGNLISLLSFLESRIKYMSPAQDLEIATKTGNHRPTLLHTLHSFLGTKHLEVREHNYITFHALISILRGRTSF
jgi:hypothetical protein